MNCNRSATAASSSLAPIGIRRSDAPNMLMPTPATGSTCAQAVAIRTGSNSGPASSPEPAPAYAAANRSAILTIAPQSVPQKSC